MKKTLAIILTAVMVLSMVITAIPFSASAEEAVLDPKNSEGLSIGEVAEGYAPAAGAIAIDSAEKFIEEFDGYTGDVLISDKDYYLTADITIPDDYWPDGYFAGTLDGCGYTISTKAPLFWALWPETAGDAGATVIKNLVINADIDVDGAKIGALAMWGGAEVNRKVIVDNVKFTGSINGDDTLDAIDWRNDWGTGGLFGQWYGGVDVTDVFVDCEDITGICVGGIIGSLSNEYKEAPVTIKDVYVNTNIISKDCGKTGSSGDTDRWAVGGIIGYAQTKPVSIENANIYGTIESDGFRQIGGMIGRIGDNSGAASSYFLFKDCTNYATIEHDSGKQASSYGGVGGMLGVLQVSSSAQYVILENCVNYGDITASTNAGGLVGVNPAGTVRIIGGANYGDITANVEYDSLYAGGIAGRAQKAITFGYDPRTSEMVDDAATVNYGTITAQSFAGGIVGGAQSGDAYLEFVNAENNGDVDAWNAGGIFGFSTQNNQNHFSNCVNNGDVYGANIGGIIGKAKKVFTLEDCTNNGDLIIVGEVDDSKEAGVGGIAGAIYNTLPEKLENLKNTGNIYGEDGELYGHNVAGIIGSIGTGEWLVSADPETWDQATFINCVNDGDIIGAGDVAGIVAHGEFAFKVIDCVNNGDITGKNAAGLVIFGFVGNNLADETVIEGNNVSGTVTGTDSAAAIVIAGEGLDIADCLDNNVIYNTCNVNAYISNGVATLTAQYPFVITNPDTGDNFAMGIVLSILAITAMGITAVVVLKKRVRN